jgi:hypothetical protein
MSAARNICQRYHQLDPDPQSTNGVLATKNVLSLLLALWTLSTIIYDRNLLILLRLTYFCIEFV